jgi:hypothetical protein
VEEGMKIWILSNPVPYPPYLTTYDEIEHDFIEAWTNTNEPHCAATKLHELCMKNNDVDTYITVFAELAHTRPYTKKMTPSSWRYLKQDFPLNF